MPSLSLMLFLKPEKIHFSNFNWFKKLEENENKHVTVFVNVGRNKKKTLRFFP